MGRLASSSGSTEEHSGRTCLASLSSAHSQVNAQHITLLLSHFSSGGLQSGIEAGEAKPSTR